VEKFFRNGQLKRNAALATMLLREIFCANCQIKICKIYCTFKKDEAGQSGAWKIGTKFRAINCPYSRGKTNGFVE
jgi:hypothetical protein